MYKWLLGVAPARIPRSAHSKSNTPATASLEGKARSAGPLPAPHIELARQALCADGEASAAALVRRRLATNGTVRLSTTTHSAAISTSIKSIESTCQKNLLVTVSHQQLQATKGSWIAILEANQQSFLNHAELVGKVIKSG